MNNIRLKSNGMTGDLEYTLEDGESILELSLLPDETWVKDQHEICRGLEAAFDAGKKQAMGELKSKMHQFFSEQKGSVMSDSEIEPHTVVRLPSLARGCEGKANLGRGYQKQAEKMKRKHGKEYGVYHCPYCGGTHLTTKLEKRHEYPPLIYQTNRKDQS